MKEITFLKLNEVTGQVICNDLDMNQSLYNKFSIYAEKYWFDKRVKNGVWDGKIHFIKKNGEFDIGNLQNILEYCEKQKDYTINLDPSFFPNTTDKKEFAKDFLDTIADLPLPFTPHQHQYRGAIKACYYKRGILEHCTSSGKSLMQTLIIYYFMKKNPNEKVLLLVPRIGLVEQFYTDMIGYGINPDWLGKYYGEEKQPDKKIVISTWQSAHTQKGMLKEFTMLLCDEAHTVKNLIVRSVSENCINAHLRIGVTGTMPDEKSTCMFIAGVLGPVLDIATIEEMSDKGIISKSKIYVVYMKYSDEENKQLKAIVKDYKKQFTDDDGNLDRKEFGKKVSELEKDFQRKHPKRNNYIYKISNKLVNESKNILILINRLDHGDLLIDYFTKQGITPHLITGEKEIEDRIEIQNNLEKEGGQVLIATLGTFSTGISVKRLNAIILADISQAKITTLQSIGRGLRLHFSKNRVLIFDMADDLTYGNKHLQKRLQMYANQNFETEIKEVSFA
jgi:superfamily II DNA or RNA helicase